MTVTIHRELEQGSGEWLNARAGLLTASTIGKLITPTTKKPANNDTSRALINTLAAERITGYVEYIMPTFDMQRGAEEEPLARDLYAERYAPVEEVGFIVREEQGWRLGYSPDGLVGDDGLIEIKSRKPAVHIRTILAGQPPAENLAQIQAGLFVTGREWLDYISYCAGMRMWVKRVRPDPAWFDAIENAAQSFEAYIDQIITTYNTGTSNMPDTERRARIEEITF